MVKKKVKKVAKKAVKKAVKKTVKKVSKKTKVSKAKKVVKAVKKVEKHLEKHSGEHSEHHKEHAHHKSFSEAHHAILRAHAVGKKNVVQLTSKRADKMATMLDHKIFMKTGLKGLDELFEKDYGIPIGSSVLIEGGPGSGKTIMCLALANQFCQQGKRCLYMSFEEPEERLMEHMNLFKWHAEEYIKKGLMRVKRFEAIDVSRSVEALLSAAKRELLIEIDPVLFPHDFKPDVVFIDSLTSIASAFSGHSSRFRIYMEQLFRYLEKNQITTFLIREVATPTHVGSSYKEEGEAVSFLSDGIICLYNVILPSGKRESAMEILKMRGSSFKRGIYKMTIESGKGFTIHPDQVVKTEMDSDNSRLT